MSNRIRERLEGRGKCGEKARNTEGKELVVTAVGIVAFNVFHCDLVCVARKRTRSSRILDLTYR